MENGGIQRVLSSWDNHEESTNRPKKFHVEDAIYVKHKRPGLLSSASAHDLRHFDLEKEKEDASSPRGVLEAYARSFDHPPQSAEVEAHCTNLKEQFRWSKIFKLWKRKPFKRLASFPPFGVPKIPKRKSRITRENPILSSLNNIRSSLVNFSLSELATATNNFSNENLIGRGGFSKVYKGRLQDGQLVAVKRLTKGLPDERTTGFLSELGIIAYVDHPNTARLVGCGVEGGMHLVFQLSSLGSLASLLHGSNGNNLDWGKRYKIAVGIADGLLYLHESCHKRIIHRDIKAENILLTENYEPQICDFGLAKWLPKHWTHRNVSKFEGTFGYFAPEYFMHGIIDEKTDIYSFGVLLLELITGRQALDHMKQSVVIWAKPLIDSNNIKDLVDPSLGDNYDRKQIERVVLTASLCVEHSPILRPHMNQVVVLLRGNENDMEYARHRRRALLRTYSVELQDAQEYNSTKYLSNLNRLRQIALDSES